MKRLLILLAVSLLASCAGSRSTIREGFAFVMNEDQASTLVDSIIRANVASDRMLTGNKLVASGYNRSVIDTHTYTATAIHVKRSNAYGFELLHRGTLFNGPAKASRMYKELVRRADLVGERVPVNP
jgi:hypothetical protein